MKKLFLAVVVALVVFTGTEVEVKAAPATEESMEASMLEKINDLREANGLEALEVDPTLVSVAEIRAEEITVKWSHTRPDGTDGLDLIPLSYGWAGENLSYCINGDDVADRTMNALVNSPTHLENMVAPEYNNIGIAAYIVNDCVYVAYCFGS